MPYDSKISRIADILIEKHGRRATGVARRRAKQRIDRGDLEAAHVWIQVLEAALGRLGTTRRRVAQGCRPRGSDLVGQTTVSATPPRRQ